MVDTMVWAGGVELCAETFGDPGAPPILLIAGAAASMVSWDAELCERLAADGRHVIRYDHRDTGRSVTYPPGKPGYTGTDLAADAAVLIDTLAGGRAHVVGISMGGGIAQKLAVEHADRVATATLVSTGPAYPVTPGTELPPPAEHLRAVFADPAPEPDWGDRDAVVEYLVEGERPFAGPESFDEAGTRAAARCAVDRTASPASANNHWLVVDAGDGEDEPAGRLDDLRAPTLVVHGTADPLFAAAYARALVREIPDAELLLLDGVGHQTPPRSTWDVVVPAVLRHTTR